MYLEYIFLILVALRVGREELLPPEPTGYLQQEMFYLFKKVLRQFEIASHDEHSLRRFRVGKHYLTRYERRHGGGDTRLTWFQRYDALVVAYIAYEVLLSRKQFERYFLAFPHIECLEEILNHVYPRLVRHTFDIFLRNMCYIYHNEIVVKGINMWRKRKNSIFQEKTIQERLFPFFYSVK